MKKVNEEEGKSKMNEIKGESVAVLFLNSYANDENEREIKKIVKKKFENVFISSEVRREIREYERLATTVVEAYIYPVIKGYLSSLKDMGREAYVMQSNGGKSSFKLVKGVNTLMSGPAGGIAASEFFSQILGEKNVITYDMGGTSADIGAIVNGKPLYTNQIDVQGIPIRVTSMDILSIGAGGGSVAWVDDGLRLRVGPVSAGAVPGPACYGRGGEKFTVTDANLLLGVLGEEISGVKLKKELAVRAGKKIGEKIGMSVEELAEGVRRIVNNNMAMVIKKISISRGYDPRDFVLFAYGGAGPMHACAIAREVGIRKIVVPPMPGAFSSFGILLAPVRYDYTETIYKKYEEALPQVDEVRKKFEREIKEKMKNYEIHIALRMRYRGQGHEIEIPYDENAREKFEAKHEELYGFKMNDDVYVIDAIFIATMKRELKLPRFFGKSKEIKGMREYMFSGRIPVYTIEHFDECEGPCIVESETATILIESGWRGEIGNCGEIKMEVNE